MANFLSRFRRQSNQPIFNKANTNRLNGQVRGLVGAIRKLKTSVPSNLQTTNAFINGTKTERNVLNRAIVNFVVKYNKAVDKTNVAAAAVQQAPSKLFPTPSAAVQQARQATQQAQVAAQRMQQQVAQTTPRNRIANLTNDNLSNNTKINATIKRIRGMNPNLNWYQVNANGLTNAQKKVLNGLRNPFYTGIKRQATPAYEGNLSSMFKQGAATFPAPNANVRFLMSLGNQKPSNANYSRVVRIANTTKNPVAKKMAQNIINNNIYSRL